MYIPILKTTSAELKAFKALSSETQELVTPLFELTKDRTHKTLYPDGRLEKALEKALDARKEGDLILDLTSHEDLINHEIEALFDSANGYKNWCDFIENTGLGKRVTPVVQIDGDKFFDEPQKEGKEISAQVKKLIEHSGRLVLRLPLDIGSNDAKQVLSFIYKEIEPPKLLILIDAAYVRPGASGLTTEEVFLRISEIESAFAGARFALAASSFPKFVVAAGYGGEKYGVFQIEEVNLHSNVAKRLPKTRIIYSDYASIHPLRYESSGGGRFIPRIDLPLQHIVYYYRRRNSEGGYIAAAKLVLKDEKYEDIGSWGNKQIELASKDAPAGLSPSFWISVRSNIHMTTQAYRINSNK